MRARDLPPAVGLRVDPAEIRRAIDLSHATTVVAAAAATGYGHATIDRWRSWQKNAAAAGYEWPTALDDARYKANAHNRERTRRYKPYKHTNRRRRVDATGTNRRLQALAAIGWTRKHVADAAGIPHMTLQHIDTDTLFDTTVDAVRRAYDQLSMAPGPSNRNRARAARFGWPPPLDWNDEDIDDPNALSYTQQMERRRNKQIVARRRERQAAA